jgi:hypothetical protein
MLAMAICADRRISLTLSSEFAVNAIPIIMLDTLMATAAGFGDIEMIYRGTRISRWKDNMGSAVGGMAIVASGGKVYSAKRGFAVYATFKNLNRFLHRDLMFLNKIDILVTMPTGGGEIEGVDT